MPSPAHESVRRASVHHCRLPVKGTRAQGSGAVGGAIEVVVIRIETSGGITGWGEAAPWTVFTGTPEAAAAALARYLVPIALGRDIATIPAIMADCERALVGHPEAKAALETALLDALGRARGVPVHELLGGRSRDAIPLSVSLADPDIARDLDLLDRLTAAGIGIVKVKTGVDTHAIDLARLGAIRARAPDIDLRIDYNQGLAPAVALQRVRDVEAFRPTFIEQPVPASQREAMAAIAAAIDTPILADESVFSPDDALRAVRDRIADLISIKIMKSGGPRRGLEIAAIAAAGGMACYGGDMFETGIAHLAGTHMIAAAPNISLGCEFYQATFYLEHDLLAAPFPIADGQVRVPTTAGLGIDVDIDAVRAHSIAHREITA